MKNVLTTFWVSAIFALFCVLNYPSEAIVQTIENSSANSNFTHFTHNFQDLNFDLPPIDLQSEEIETDDDDTETNNSPSFCLIQTIINNPKNTAYPLHLHFKNNRFRHLYLLFEVFRL